MTTAYIGSTEETFEQGAGEEPGCCGEPRAAAVRHHGHPSSAGRRCCTAPAGQVRSFLQARLIMLLLEQPSHGYELMERLAADGETPVDPGLLYRTLRLLEDDGVVRSVWETAGAGPARRLYQATPDGVDYLHSWAASIRALRLRLDRFLTAYEGRFRV